MGDDRRIPWFRTDLGEDEIQALARAVRGRHITQGPLTARLEERLAATLGVPHAVLVANGALALVAALLALGVGPGDEVIMPSTSFVASAHAPLLLGARPVLVDVLPERPLLDVARVEAAIGPRTRAIMPVHLDGRAADLDGVHALARAHGLHVVEDAAQALGAANARGPLGTQSTVGCFSLGITKLVTTGEGGCCVTRDEALARRLREVRNHGTLSLADGGFGALGSNLRLTDLQAAMGLAQVDSLGARIEALGGVYRRYAEGLAGLSSLRLIEVDQQAGELPLWVEAIALRRDEVIRRLGEQGIEARPYPAALCDLPHLGGQGEHPWSRRWAAHGLILPSGPHQPPADLERTIAAVREIAAGLEGDVAHTWRRAAAPRGGPGPGGV